MAINLNNNSASAQTSSISQAQENTGVISWGQVPEENYFVLRTTVSPKGLKGGLDGIASGGKGKVGNVHNGQLVWGWLYEHLNFALTVNILPTVRKDGEMVFDDLGNPKFVDSSQGIHIFCKKAFSVGSLSPELLKTLQPFVGLLGTTMEEVLEHPTVKPLVLGAVVKEDEKRVDTAEWLRMLQNLRTMTGLMPSKLKVSMGTNITPDFPDEFKDALDELASEEKPAVLEVYIPFRAEARKQELGNVQTKKENVVYDVLDPEGNKVPEARFQWGTPQMPVLGVVLKPGKHMGIVDTSRMYSNEYVTKSIDDILCLRRNKAKWAEENLLTEKMEDLFRKRGNKWHLHAGLLPALGAETCEYWECSDKELPVWEAYIRDMVGVKKVPYGWEGKAPAFTHEMATIIIKCREARSADLWLKECVPSAKIVGISKVVELPEVPVVVEAMTPPPSVEEVKVVKEVTEVKSEAEVSVPDLTPNGADAFADEIEEPVTLDEMLGLFS